MQKQISEKLFLFEEQEQVKILHAVESGSRAWGFASPDSDYDVRCIYVRPLENYLQLNPIRDVIEFQLDEVLDINGWDFQKMLKLLYKSNPTIFEWANSPIVYRTTEFFQKLKPMIFSYFSPKTSIYHYLNMAKATYHAYCEKEQVKFKKYFYVLRPLLACYWILEKQTPPPMLFSDLLELEQVKEIRPLIHTLLEMKALSSETRFIPKNEPLDQWIHQQIQIIQKYADAMPFTENSGWNALNEAFLSCLKC